MEQVDQYTFESLHNIAIWWEEAENNLKTNERTGSFSSSPRFVPISPLDMLTPPSSRAYQPLSPTYRPSSPTYRPSSPTYNIIDESDSESDVINTALTNKQDLIPDSRNELMKTYNKIFGILLSRKLPLSSHEINDFDQVGRVRNGSFL